MIDRDAILTDGEGRPIPRPERADFASDYAYARAFHEYKDRVRAVASAAFDAAFRKAMRR